MWSLSVPTWQPDLATRKTVADASFITIVVIQHCSHHEQRECTEQTQEFHN